jgi:hypothetical protein
MNSIHSKKISKTTQKKNENLDNKRKENNKTPKKMSSIYVPSKHNFTSLPDLKKKKPKKFVPRSTSTSKSKSKTGEETKLTYKLHVPKLQSIDETRQIVSKFENIQG